MEKNIFEGAKFGDPFLTRDGRIAIAVDIRPNYVSLFVSRGEHQLWGEFSYSVKDNGILDKEDTSLKDLDIVSKYHEDIINSSLIQEFGEACYDRGYTDANKFEYGKQEEGNILFEDWIKERQ